MKFTPLARLSLSSAGCSPSKMLGLLRTSSCVKCHWFDMATGVFGIDRAGDGALRRDCGLGGDVRDELVGGEGAGGGMSRRFDGDLEELLVVELLEGAVGSW